MWQRLPDTGGLKSMNKIEDAFKNKKAFIPFVTAGDPSLDVTRELILAMQEAGADLIEIGIPFSDPVAEGPVIQEADDRALSAGVTTDKIFDMVDEYMIDEAKAAGASAVLLICALLDEETLTRYHKHCDELGLSALVEAHDEEEIQMAVRAGARIIGVNNRNLKDFTVDIHNGIRLREKVPKEILFVAESGIKTRENIVELEKGCVNAVLIGETFMRSENKEQMLQQLKGE